MNKFIFLEKFKKYILIYYIIELLLIRIHIFFLSIFNYLKIFIFIFDL
jgi:hypothetical protein